LTVVSEANGAEKSGFATPLYTDFSIRSTAFLPAASTRVERRGGRRKQEGQLALHSPMDSAVRRPVDLRRTPVGGDDNRVLFYKSNLKYHTLRRTLWEIPEGGPKVFTMDVSEIVGNKD